MIDEEAAARVVEEFRHRPFAWGSSDCKTFAARFVDARTGSDFLRKLEEALPPYMTPLQAIHIVKAAGGWEPLITSYLGEPVPLEQAEFGDVVLTAGAPPFERSRLLGICDEELVMAPAALGLVWLPMSCALKVWKCPQR